MKENDRMPRDYRQPLITIVYIVLLLTHVYIYHLTSTGAFILMTIILIMILVMVFVLIICAFDSPMQKLAKRDFKNNYKDNKLYSICNDYKSAYDSIKKEYDDIEANEKKRNACKKAINERFKKM